MGESCALKPVVRNKEGKEVESKLFNSLLDYSNNNREFAKKWYFVGTNKRFLNSNHNRITFDENGEITFQSLKNLVDLDIKSEKLIQKLEKDLGAGVLNYDIAISRMENFNKNNPYNDEYMATIIPTEEGKVSLQVVKRTAANRRALEETITNKGLFDRIKQAVERIGGAIEFITEGYSRYDTIHARKLESGLYSVIQLASGDNLTAELAEEAGHFAVGALGNNPLVQRLESLCTPEVQQRILGEHYSDVQSRTNPKRETAGFLVGQYIAKQADLESPIRNLVGRIVNLAKRMFYKITRNDVERMRVEAEAIAKNIARGFMKGTEAGSVEQALGTKEILYSAKDPANISTFKKIVKELDSLASKMSAIDRDLFKKWKGIETSVAMDRLFEHYTTLAEVIAFDGIYESLSQLINNSNEMIEFLNDLTPYTKETRYNAKRLRAVRAYVDHAIAIHNLINDLTTRGDYLASSSEQEKALVEAKKQLGSILYGSKEGGSSGIAGVLLEKERELYLSFVKDIYGKDYVKRAKRLIFDTTAGKLGRLVMREEETEKFSVLLEETHNVDGWWTRWATSMADSTDYFNQISYMAVTAAQDTADTATLKVLDRLRVIEAKAKSLGLKPKRMEFLFETKGSKRGGAYTGNYISELNWGDWEDEWIAFKEEEKRKFLERADIASKSRIEKDFLWDDYFRPKAKAWHKAHSTFDKDLGRYKPNDSYINPLFFETIKPGSAQETIYKEIIELKRELDNILQYKNYRGEMVQAAHTNPYRMPQFRGSTQNRIENHKRSMSLGKAVKGSLRQNLVNAFTLNSEDRDYGSAETQNTIDEDIFSDEATFEAMKLHRIPLYGINKLRDMSELTTDVFNGLLQYAAMANTYEAMSTIVDAFEVGKVTLYNRKVKGVTEAERAKDKGSTSNNYIRYLNFLNAQVYNIYAPRKNFGVLLVNKLTSLMTALGTKLFLGGNVPGGIVNLGTGALEAFKEALVAEHYSLADWWKANSIYRKNLGANLLNAGKEIKDDKLSLFMRMFNVRGDFSQRIREYSTRKSRLTRLNPLGDSLLAPYKTGDHYMQSIAYLAVANRLKFVDSNGKKISLWDALEVKPIDENNPKAGKTMAFKDNLMFVDPETGALREWTQRDKVKFQALCRQLNNRMHGVYNKIDKTTFHNSIIGSLILSMRGYALGFIQRRFSTNRYNLILGRESEGTLTTLSKTAAAAMPWFGGELKNFFKLLGSPLILPLSKRAERVFSSMGFSAAQCKNARRGMADYVILGLLGLIKYMLSKGDDDDDDDVSIAYYFAARLFMEQAAYNSPIGAAVEIKTVASPIPVAWSAVVAFFQLMHLAISGERYEDNKNGHKKGDSKFKHKIKSYIPYYRTVNVLSDPGKAVKNYEYGRVTYK